VPRSPIVAKLQSVTWVLEGAGEGLQEEIVVGPVAYGETDRSGLDTHHDAVTE
jgi:hypothetical protein